MTTAILCGHLFDGTGSDAAADRVLMVHDGKVVDGPRPSDAAELDLRNLFVMPGLVDAHSHVSIVLRLGDQWAQKRRPAVEQALCAPFNLRQDLLGGTTTMRVMGEEDWIDLHVRDAIRAGFIDGPELFCATRPLAPSHGFGRITVGYDGVEYIRRAVRENLYRGADFIKVFATGSPLPSGATAAEYTFEELAVMVEEAARGETYVAAHATGGQGLDDAVRAGVRTIEHAWDATDEQLELILEHDIWVVSTQGIANYFSPHREDEKEDDHGRFEELKRRRDRSEARMRTVLTSGVRLALGTDHVHGGMADEIQEAIRLGVSPKDALLAATSGGAEAIGVAERTGTLVSGKFADLIGIDGNPLDDPTALGRIRFVMKDGRRLL
jgi:imidazolonepropionase-like amidohydrolase